jgi:hypothetical protein
MSNLGNLIKHYPKYTHPNMEHIAAYIQPPWWKSAAITEIAPTGKDEAAKAHQQRLHQIPTQDLIIYTDRLGYNRQIGAAIHSPTANTTKDAYISTDCTVGKIMVISMFRTLCLKSA